MDKVIRIGMAVVRSLIILIGLVTCAIIIASSVSEESFFEGMSNYGGALNLAYGTTLFVMILCVIAIVLFGTVFFFMNIKSRMGTLIGIVGMIVIALVSVYALGSSEVTPDLARLQDVNVTPNLSQNVGGSLYMVYILGGIALVSILWAEISRWFK